jgi:hypothetical protein
MVIMRVSKSKEKAMLNTVRMLRRLLRKAFLVTNRLSVIWNPKGKRSVPSLRSAPTRVDSKDKSRKQLRQQRLLPADIDLHCLALLRLDSQPSNTEQYFPPSIVYVCRWRRSSEGNG